jgi:hypothetical protein
MTATQAVIRLSADGAIRVEPFIRLTGHTHILCCTYEDSAPILAIDDGTVSLSVTVPDTAQVTGEDLKWGRALADAVARYVAGLEHRATIRDGAAGEAA